MGASLKLAWMHVSTVVSFQIQRSFASDGTGFTLVASPAAGVTTYTDINLTEDKIHYYRVRAISPNAAVAPGPWTEIVSAKTLIAAPAAPTGLTVTPI